MTIVFHELQDDCLTMKMVMLPEGMPWGLTIEHTPEGRILNDSDYGMLRLLFEYGSQRHVIIDSTYVRSGKYRFLDIDLVKELFQGIIRATAEQTAKMERDDYVDLAVIVEQVMQSYQFKWKRMFIERDEFQEEREFLAITRANSEEMRKQRKSAASKKGDKEL